MLKIFLLQAQFCFLVCKEGSPIFAVDGKDRSGVCGCDLAGFDDMVVDTLGFGFVDKAVVGEKQDRPFPAPGDSVRAASALRSRFPEESPTPSQRGSRPPSDRDSAPRAPASSSNPPGPGGPRPAP